MERKIVFLSTIFLAALILAGNGQGQSLTFKFTGGLGTSDGRDYNPVIEGTETYLAGLAALLGVQKTGVLEKIRWGHEYDFEFIIHLNKILGIGLGVGSIQRKIDTISTLTDAGYELSASFTPKFSAHYAVTHLYLFLPLQPALDFYLDGGLLYCCALGKYTHSIVENGVQLMHQKGSIRKLGFGFEVGVGLRFGVSRWISLFIEGRGRYLRLQGWDGHETLSCLGGAAGTNEGNTYYYELDTGVGILPQIITGVDPAQVGLLLGLPVGNAKRFAFSFTGFSIVAGIMFHV